MHKQSIGACPTGLTSEFYEISKRIHAVLSYKERLYKEQLVEHENHKERTLVKLGRVKEHPQLSKYAL